MARIAVVTSSLAGRLNASLEAARRLGSAGHEVILICDREEVAEQARELSLEFVLLPVNRVSPSTEAARRPFARAAALFRRLGEFRKAPRLREEKVDSLDPESFARMSRELAPDLILVDIELPVQIMAAYQTGLRLALINDMLSLWKRPGLPPLSSDIIPGRGWWGTPVGIEIAWLGFRLSKMAQRLRFRITRAGLDRRSVLELVARRTGFPIDEEASDDQWLIPFVYRTIPTLTLNAVELEFPHTPPANVHYVGPQIANRYHGEGADPTPLAGDDLNVVLRRCREDPERSLVYCSFGAFGDRDARLLDHVSRAVADRPEWELVVGLGGKGNERGRPSSPNVHIYEWAPQLAVLQEADCAIHHAGTHSINECIYMEVPMLLYPDDALDHAGNAARVAYHGLGTIGDARADTPESIRRHIERCLADRDMKRSLAAMAARFRDYDDKRTLEQAVESLLEA